MRPDRPIPFPPAKGTPQAEDESTSHLRLRIHRGFASNYLPDLRDLIVYLPPGYENEPQRSYPVLYLQDGQNLFDEKTPYLPGRTWRVREHADAAIQAREVEPLVIVGIGNAGERRLAEYTPEPDAKFGGGEAEFYGRMLTEELMPWIEERYRIQRDRDSTGLGGSSLGALAALYVGLEYPEAFGRLAVLSPSVWWANKSILRYVHGRAPHLGSRPRLWLDIGRQEGYRTVLDAEELSACLQANGWHDGATMHYECVRGGTHDEASWARRVRPMLRFLFPASAAAALHL